MKELIILGAGPAAFSASIYALRYKIKHLIIGAQIGGYLNEIHKVENYPGFSNISGFELSQNFKKHLEYLGGDIVQEKIEKIEKIENFFEIQTSKNTYQAKNLIYALGTKHRDLRVKGEKEFLGKGVSYCATCDGPFFKNKKVIVVGGGNSAAAAALMLSEHAEIVYLIYRKDKLTCTPSYSENIEENTKIKTIPSTNILEIKGDNSVSEVVLDDKYKNSNILKTHGVFIEIGSSPDKNLLKELDLKIDHWGYIETNKDQSTNIEGFFAAGDLTTNSNRFRQIVTATSEGAIAAFSVFEKIKKINNE